MALRNFLIGSTLVAMPALLGGARPWISSPLAAFFFFGVVLVTWRESGSNFKKEHKPLPSLKDFRESLRISGESFSTTVVHMRNQERY